MTSESPNSDKYYVKSKVSTISSFSISKKARSGFVPGEDFESDSDETPIDLSSRVPFVSSFIAEEDKKVIKVEQAHKTINFFDFVELRSEFFKTKQNPQVCEVCGKHLKSPASKGGHMSKHHPQMSEKYIRRKITHAINRNERKRAYYLNKLH